MIHLLSEDTIQKIAAGEVIERPVSVVKELAENSIDAGATEITVEIEAGGKEKILVSDNGKGIPEEEMEVAFLRHATSKITGFEDLYSVKTMGFRGEALASIAAVADVRARSRQTVKDTGLEIQFEAGQMIRRKKVAMPSGTTMEVKNLFSNVPVRRKFLKSDAAEANQISSLLYRLAIGHPEISFRFIKDGRRVFQTRRENTFNENLMLLFGSAYHDALLAVDAEDGDYHIHGRIANNTFFRGNRAMQFFYINGRTIEDDALRNAAEEPYKSVIPNGRYPAFQIFIETDPKNIDINVHPNKQKVKFDHEETLLHLIEQTLHRTLFSHSVIPTQKKETPGLFQTLSTEESYQQILDQYGWPSSEHKQTPSSDDLPDTAKTSTSKEFPLFETSCRQNKAIYEIDDEDDAEPDSNFMEQKATADDSGVIQMHAEGMDLPKKHSVLPDFEELKFIGIAFRTYILLQHTGREELYLIDQHAAHERINYERYRKQFETDMIVSQQLALPLTLQLTSVQMETLALRGEILRRAGFDFSILGENRVALRAVPTIFKSASDDQVFFDLIDMDYGHLKNYEEIIDQIATKACRASVKQGDVLSYAEVRALYLALSQTEFPLTCPHGRPTIVVRKKSDLEKMFLRVLS